MTLSNRDDPLSEQMRECTSMLNVALEDVRWNTAKMTARRRLIFVTSEFCSEVIYIRLATRYLWD